MVNKDKAGENYWTTLWETHKLPDPIKTNGLNPNKYINKRMHQYFQNIFSKIDVNGKSILEIGCANSVWLPYFAHQHNMKVTGIDYSEFGCEQARRILERDNVNSEVICVDFYDPPKRLLNNFDFVFSLGVVEHFEDTAEVLEIFSKFLKSGGIILTEIPNMTSLEGKFHKWFNKEVYDIHNVMDKDDLIQAHKKAGFEILDASYLISLSFYVNLKVEGKKVKLYPIKKALIYSLSTFAKIIWTLENFIGSLRVSKMFSPIIFVIGKKQG